MIFQPGQLILHDKYRVEKLIGQGAYAEVYLATHVDLGVPRAVKVLRADAPGVGSTILGDYRQRFRLEFQLAARLDHLNVVKVHDLVEEPDAIYAVLEYAPGGSVADLLRERGPLPVEQAARILLDCARGLEALHDRLDAIHRDVKPSNILLGEDGRARIADLGLAQVAGGENSGRPQLSSLAGMHPGTMLYRSPEHDTWQPLRPTSDVYSLGCTAFEMLTGKAWKQAMVKVERVRELRPEVPDWLDAVVARMLCENPGLRASDAGSLDKRYVTMGAVLGAVKERIDRVEHEERQARERVERERLEQERLERAERERLKRERHEETYRKSPEAGKRDTIVANEVERPRSVARVGPQDLGRKRAVAWATTFAVVVTSLGAGFGWMWLANRDSSAQITSGALTRSTAPTEPLETVDTYAAVVELGNQPTPTGMSPASRNPEANTSTAGPLTIVEEIEALEEQLRTNPKDVEKLVELGKLLFDEGQYAKASDLFAKALEVDPRNTGVRFDLGQAHFFQGLIQPAEGEFRRVIEAERGHVLAHYSLALLLSHKNPPDIDGAIAEWKEVIRLAPGSDTANKAQAFVDAYQ